MTKVSGKFNADEEWTTDWLGQVVEPGDTVCYFHGGRYDSLNLVLVEKITAEGHVRGELLNSSRDHQDLTRTTIKRNRMVRVDGVGTGVAVG